MTALLLGALLLLGACGKQRVEADTSASGATPHSRVPNTLDTATSKEPQATPTALRSPHSALAKRLIASIGEVERARDVTCWTSFRQLDAFVSSLPFSEHATLTKIAGVKRLVAGLWAQAVPSDGRRLTEADFRRLLPVQRATTAPMDRSQLRAVADYRTTSERWRVLLALVFDELRRPTGLVPLEDGAESVLAELVDRLSIALLTAAGRHAHGDGAREVGAAHVRKGLDEVSRAFGLELKARGPHASQPASNAELQALTRALNDDKLVALKRFNRTPQAQVDAFNRISKLPFTPEAIAHLVAHTKRWADPLVRGERPMRADTFYPMAQPSTVPKAGAKDAPKDRNTRYVTAVFAANAIADLFPHEVAPNADLVLHFQPSPGLRLPKVPEGGRVTLRDYQMDAVRDTAIHWQILRSLWDDRPFALDPFAAEYISEVVSVKMTLLIRRAQTEARRAKKTVIDLAAARKAPIIGLVMVPPPQPATWTDADRRARDAALKRHPGPHFVETTATSGLARKRDLTRHDSGAVMDGSTIQAVAGGGVGVGDVNRDGYPDLFIGGEGVGRLFVNQGAAAPGTLTDATIQWGIPEGMDDVRQALLVDIDGDGDDDLVAIRSRRPSRVMVNEGERYRDATAAMGLQTHPGAHTAAIFDADGDGDLDLLVGYYGADRCNQAPCAKGANVPTLDGRNGSPNQLWLWDSDARRFSRGPNPSGLEDTGWALAMIAFDADHDGDQDVYVANDFGPNGLFENLGTGTFRDVSAPTRTNDRGSGMNVSLSDVDGDGRLDVHVTNIDMFSKRIKVVFPVDEAEVGIDEATLRSFRYIDGNKLFINPGAMGERWPAVERTRFEPGDRGWGWGAVFFDMDHDGDEDLYLANGWIPGSLADRQRNQLFLRDNGRFLQLRDDPSAFAANSRAVVPVDIDRDGDVDLIMTQFLEAPRVFTNASPKRGTFVTVRLVGKAPNTGAIGARVQLTTAGRTQVRAMTAGMGYIAQGDPVLHFGVPGAPGLSATVDVTWPDEQRTQHRLTLGRQHMLRQP